jgi:Zn-dependent protease
LGRVTLNPIAHIDIIGTIVVPIVLLVFSRGRVGFGWAKPVPVNPLNFRHPRRGVLLVSLAGPASNILLAAVGGVLLRAVGGPALGEEGGNPLVLILTAVTIINLFLAFFNLIPIPPLDGSGVISAALPVRLAVKYESLGRVGGLVVLGLIMLGSFVGVGVIEYVILPPAAFLFRLFTGFWW